MVEQMQYGTSAKTSEDATGVPVLRMGNIQNGELMLDVLKYLPADHDEFPGLLLRDGDVLFNRTNSAELVGKTAVYRGNPTPCSCASYLIRLRLLPAYVPEFLAYYINSPFGRAWVSTVVSQQVGQANVNGTKLKALSVPVPGHAEQEQVVAEIEKQFTRLGAGVAALQRVQANLKRYRAAVLKAACEGRLVPTEAELARKEARPYETGGELLARVLMERREQGQGRGSHKEPLPAERVGSALPVGWSSASVDQLSVHLTSGSRNWSQFYDHGTGTFILAQNVRPMRLDLTERQAVAAPVGDAETERTRVQENDILVTIVGAKTGDVCRVPGGLVDHFVCQSVALVRPVLAQTARFAELYLASQENGQAQWKALIYGQGRPHLSFEQLRTTEVALPPLAEQARIVAEVERRLSVVDEMDAAVAANLQRATRLRQSVLQSAFAPDHGARGGLHRPQVAVPPSMLKRADSHA